MAGAGFALRVELEQLGRHVAHGLLDPPLGLLPGAAAQFVDHRARTFGARVLLDAIEALHRDLELVAALVDQDHELATQAAHFDGFQPLEAADTVVLVHDEVADLEVPEVGEEAARRAATAAVEMHFLREDVAVGEDAQGHVRQLESRAEHAQADLDPGAFVHGQPVLPQHVLEPLCPAGRAQEEDGRSLGGPEVAGQGAEVSGITPRRTGGNVEAARVEVHLAHVDGRREPDPLLERGGRHQDLVDGEGQRVLATRALLVGAVVERIRLRGHLFRIQGRHRPAGQDVPGGNGGAGDQGKEVRDLFAGQAALDALQQRGQLAHAREPLRQRAAQAVEHGARREGVGERQDLEAIERARGALGLGVERAQALHGVPEKLDADGDLPVRGEHVEDASPSRDLAGAGDRILAAISAFVEGFEQDLGGEVFAALDRDDTRLEQTRSEDGPKQPGRGGDERAQPPPQGRVHGGGAAKRGLRMARQSPERRGARRGKGEDGAAGARLLGQRAQVLGHALDHALGAHHDEEGRAGDEQREEKPRRPGEAMEGDEAFRGQAAARLRDPRVGGDGADPGGRGASSQRGGEARRAHGRRMRDTIDVVDRPGRSSTRTTRPPPLSTSSRPTMASGAQSAPLTSTSGESAEITARGVSSS